MDQLKEIARQECGNLGLDDTKSNLLIAWTKILEKHLHVVVSLSPVHPD